MRFSAEYPVIFFLQMSLSKQAYPFKDFPYTLRSNKHVSPYLFKTTMKLVTHLSEELTITVRGLNTLLFIVSLQSFIRNPSVLWVLVDTVSFCMPRVSAKIRPAPPPWQTFRVSVRSRTITAPTSVSGLTMSMVLICQWAPNTQLPFILLVCSELQITGCKIWRCGIFNIYVMYQEWIKYCRLYEQSECPSSLMLATNALWGNKVAMVEFLTERSIK